MDNMIEVNGMEEREFLLILDIYFFFYITLNSHFKLDFANFQLFSLQQTFYLSTFTIPINKLIEHGFKAQQPIA